jgi:hypothetical protein
MHGRIVALFLLFAIPAAAQAGPDGYIIRCTKGKQVSIQNVPCEPGWKQQGETGVYYAPADTERARRELKATQDEVARRNARMHQARQRSRGSYTRADCESAQGRRDRARQQIGSLRLTQERENELCLAEARACGSCRSVPREHERPMFERRPPIHVSAPAPASSTSATRP